MKKIIIISFMLIISFPYLYGQWYVKNYNVTDINSLSKGQLEESLLKSKKDLLISGLIAGTGGVVFIIFKFLQPGMSDDPSFFEQLIGDKGVNDIGMITGAGILIGGTIASIAYLGRIVRIKSVIKKNYPLDGSVNILPAMILNNYTQSYCPGFTLNYNF